MIVFFPIMQQFNVKHTNNILQLVYPSIHEYLFVYLSIHMSDCPSTRVCSSYTSLMLLLMVIIDLYNLS